MGSYTLGLTISLYGIGITFLALGAVILLIKLLLWLFPAKTTGKTSQFTSPDEDPNISHVVAFAAAWWSQRQPVDHSLGANLESPHGNWWAKAGD